MKKMYFLFVVAFTTLVYGQTPIITAIADGDCTGGLPKMLEIYAQGTVDFTQFTLQKQNNANTTWDSDYDLSEFGTVTDAFIYVASEDTVFPVEFPSATNFKKSSVLNVNGDDKLRIIQTSNSSVIDVYGEGGDGTGTAWEYKDGYAKRNNNTEPSATFDASQWTFSNGALNGEGTCQSGTTFEDVMGGVGTFTTTTAGTIDVVFDKSTFIKNTVINNQLHFATNSDVKVYDMSGKVVKSAQVSENKSLDMNDLPKGMYIVTAFVDGKKVSEKVIKK